MSRRTSLDELERATSDYTGLDLRPKNRTRSPMHVGARRLAYHAMRYEGYSYPEIGRHFDKHHTTIIAACKYQVADQDLWNVVDLARSYVLEADYVR